jgi:ATP-dependent DNA helicase Rep
MMNCPMHDTLNPAQLEAVHHLSGPCLVIAGAGSGKTRVITHKIARLMQSGIEPNRIAAITFTNKAAREMRERIAALLGPKAARPLAISTFHALGVRMLRESGSELGLKPAFSIMDADDALGVLRDAGGTTDAALARRWQWAISGWKNQGLTPEQASAVAASDDERVAARVWQRYAERLTAYQAVDFDDLIQLPLSMMSRCAAARAAWRGRFDHVLVDEMQDTNAVQYALLKELVDHDDDRRRGRFTAVGDDDQSIYGWRGATLDNLKSLRDDWPKLKIVALEQNYRSTGSILRAANHVIAANPKLFAKKLWSEYGDGEPVRVAECDSEEHEAERAVAFIQAKRAEGGEVTWRDFAILYRANHQSRVFEQKLRAAQMPYKVSGGQSFFDRAEIRDLCAWMRLLVNNDDDPAFLRAATTPKRGIGHQTLATLGEFANKAKTSLFEALFMPSLAAVLAKRSVEALHEFGREVNDLELRARHAAGQDQAKRFLLDWLKAIGYEQHLHDGEDSAKLAAARWTNVLDFVDWIARRCSGPDDTEGGSTAGMDDVGGGAAGGRSVRDAAQTISIIASLADRDDGDVITLSTLHAAKGLEWPHVMLAGVNEGVLPFATEAQPMTPERLQEERRLMYVGITRARRTLVVSSLKRRKRGREMVAAVPSRFIAEMKLHEGGPRADPKAKLAALRAQLSAKVDAAAMTEAAAMVDGAATVDANAKARRAGDAGIAPDHDHAKARRTSDAGRAPDHDHAKA